MKLNPVRTVKCALALVLAWCAAGAGPATEPEPLAWPQATRDARPWTRWWWLGSAVDEPNLTRLLEQYHRAGLGGVEICPIYGAKGYEDRYIDFLSPKWMAALAHTTSEARRLDMGVDMTTGTGWPFGGPWVSRDEASSGAVLKAYDVQGGARLPDRLPEGRPQHVAAVSDKGERVDLTDHVTDRRLDWTAPAGKWRVYALLARGPVQKVKRAAPGGAGNVLDPYSVAALDKYLAPFDRAFAGFPGPKPRAHFHDSFEYYGASWTPGALDAFQKRRGYDLRAHLPALFGEGPEETAARVRSDFRETLSDLHLDFVRRWTQWSRGHGGLSRNQAHGAPGNLIDLYGAADIPETEIFREVDERQIPMLKFASSATHLSGGKLASAESFTWYGEHFQSSLADLKAPADFLFLAGVNHLVFHGIPYSPEDAGWPGWLFYASTHMGPSGGLWRDLPAFNAYLTRCQSILQSGRPSEDVLLYFPLHDIWHAPGGDLLMTFTVHNQEKWLWPQPFYKAAVALWDRGWGFDAASDRFLAAARVEDGNVVVGGNSYRVIMLPTTRLMQPATMRVLLKLAAEGATVIVHESLPLDVPGFAEVEKRREELKDLQRAAGLSAGAAAEAREVRVGRGRFLIGDKVADLLRSAGVSREPMVDQGLRFIRRTHPRGHHYFVVNRGKQAVDGWVSLGTPAGSVVIMDPLFDDPTGLAALRRDAGGATEVYVQLQPGESRVLRTFANAEVSGRAWQYARPGGEAHAVSGEWRVRFLEGGPALPPEFKIRELASWTTSGGEEAKRFAGTARYSIEFDHPPGEADDWLLDLGRVADSARVRLNGRELGTLWSAPFQLSVGPSLRAGRNALEVEVTNVAANRIADLDRRGVNWKSFHEINFVNRDYKPFDASRWPERDAGLLGPVRLAPLKRLTPAAPAGR